MNSHWRISGGDVVALVLVAVFLVCLVGRAMSKVPTPTPAPRIELPIQAIRVIDGDTPEVVVSFRFALRLTGVDTPELRKPDQHAAALVAKGVTERWVADATQRKEPLAVLLYGLGLFGRMEGDLVNRTTGQRLSAHLLTSGVAQPTAGKRHEWTVEELRQIEELAP